jgi:glycosyltransferase involved in cell wall biosynthesis
MTSENQGRRPGDRPAGTRRVLIVAYYFPPLGGIGALRALGFASDLSEFGWEATVLAPENGAYHRDPSLSFPEERVIRARSLELSRGGRRLVRERGATDTTETHDRGAVAIRLRALAHRFLYYPDAQVGWYPLATLAGQRAVARRRFDAILSSSFPVTAQLVARTLHRRNGIPWIAEFRDPWAARMGTEDPRQQRALALERSLAREATAVVMPSPTWAREHGERWDRPVAMIANGHGGAAPTPSSPHPDEELVLAHLGSYYPDIQDLRAVWSALAQLRDEPGFGPVRVRFVGEVPRVLLDELGRYGLDDVVEVTGFLSAAEAARQIAGASVLLACGPRDARPSEQGVIPAKLFDYLATELPIIYAGERPNDGATLLEGQPGCHLLAPDDVEGAIEALRACRGQRVHRDTARFARRERARELATLLDATAAADAGHQRKSQPGLGKRLTKRRRVPAL